MAEEKSLYDELSIERKLAQDNGDLPIWFTTMGWQMVKSKYLWKGSTVKETFQRMADTASKHLKGKMSDERVEYFNKRFYEILWDGHLGAASPVWNLGTDRGFNVSCAGGTISDSIFDFYHSVLEDSMLTKTGFGTSKYMGDIRSRGSKISYGGTAQGALPVFKAEVQLMRDVTQGTNRRGSWAGYIPLMHGDFDEIVDHIFADPDDANIGFNYYDEDLKNIIDGDKETIRRFQKHMKLRAVLGKGYFFFPDRVNRLNPIMYKDHDLTVLASNLCAEICLFSDGDHTFSCVLSSMNLSKYDEWKETDAAYCATVFLDCNVSEFLSLVEKLSDKERYTFEKIYRHTNKGRALGLGVMGLHTLMQEKMIPFESMEAVMLNDEIFKFIQSESQRASRDMAVELGEPEWCEGYGVRNTHTNSVAPTMSNSQLSGGVSQGIEPIIANVYQQKTAAGTVYRISPKLLEIMKAKGIYTQELVDDIGMNWDGSVQHVDWLTAHEKMVFKTAYEINQETIIDLAADRQKYIDQAQSINLFFKADADEAEIARVHMNAMFNPWIKSLYYMRSQPTSKGSTGVSEKKEEVGCVSCEA